MQKKYGGLKKQVERMARDERKQRILRNREIGCERA